MFLPQPIYIVPQGSFSTISLQSLRPLYDLPTVSANSTRIKKIPKYSMFSFDFSKFSFSVQKSNTWELYIAIYLFSIHCQLLFFSCDDWQLTMINGWQFYPNRGLQMGVLFYTKRKNSLDKSLNILLVLRFLLQKNYWFIICPSEIKRSIPK